MTPYRVAVVVGLTFGAATSLLNHARALGPLAAIVGSGAGWVIFGVGAAVVLRVRHLELGARRRTVAIALLYLAACLSYYACDWGFYVPGALRLRDDIASGRIPDPGGTSLSPDLSEWLFWSAASIPAAVLLTVVTAVVVRPRPPSDDLAAEPID